MMHCPICGGEMITGEVICKTGAGPTLYPRKPGDSELKYFSKLFFGSRDSIRSSDLEEGWYCPGCEKIIVIWSKKQEKNRGAGTP